MHGLCSVGQRGLHRAAVQLRVRRENHVNRLRCGQFFQHFLDRDMRPGNHGFASRIGGNKTIMRLNLAGPAQPGDTEPRAGDGFLMRQGFSLVWLGWQPCSTAAAAFWWASWNFSHRAVYAAFTAGVSLWAAFLIADEVCMAYAVSGTHWRLFTAQLATLLAVELLPEGEARGR